MSTENKDEVIKIRVTAKEKRQLENMAYNDGTCLSSFIRKKIFIQEKDLTRQLKRNSRLNQEKLQRSMEITSYLCSSINQFKAGVNTEKAFSEIEQGVADLCHVLN